MQKNTPSGVRKPSLPIRFIKWTAFQMISFIFAVLLLGVGYATWTSLSPSQGASGQPVNQTLVQGIINNINDLNTRVTTLVTNLTTLTTRVVAINPTGTNITAGEASVGGNLTLSGSNTWMLHTPDDGRDQLYFGKGTNGNITTWPYTFNANGTLVSSALQTNNLCLNGDCKTAWPGSGISTADLIYYAGTCDASKNGQLKFDLDMVTVGGNPYCPTNYKLTGYTASSESYHCVALRQFRCQQNGLWWRWTAQ